METNQEQTLGEKRVRIDFNVTGESAVDVIKQKSAELINIIASCPSEEGEVKRLMALAMTDIENGAMWAVKAVTHKL